MHCKGVAFAHQLYIYATREARKILGSKCEKKIRKSMLYVVFHENCDKFKLIAMFLGVN